MTWFVPFSHISPSFGPWGDSASSIGGHWYLLAPSFLPDWQMATPLDENDKCFFVSQKNFLLTFDLSLTPDSPQRENKQPPPHTNFPVAPRSPSLSAGLCECLSALHRCRSRRDHVESSFCSSGGEICGGQREMKETDKKGWEHSSGRKERMTLIDRKRKRKEGSFTPDLFLFKKPSLESLGFNANISVKK